jgi:hypothetical protein
MLAGSPNWRPRKPDVNRAKLEKHLRQHGCHVHYHDGKHDIWINPVTGQDAPVPRHTEITKWTARGVCKAPGVPPAPGG